MTTFARRLGLVEAIGISVAVLCPSVGMAFNITLLVQAAGAAAPLTFALGTAVVFIVGLSFVAFSRRQPHAGAAYAYINHAFGPWLGTAAGWTTLLAYFGYATGFAAITAGFTIAGLNEFGLHADGWALPIAIGTTLVCAWLAWQDAKLASRLMLGLELASMAAITVLAVVVLRDVRHTTGFSAAPFTLRAAHAVTGGGQASAGLPALGYGLVFALLCFAGFEGATTLSEETENPRRTIPLAMLGAVLGAGAFFVFVSYAVVLGYGLDRMPALASAQAPLDELARIHIGRPFAILLDFANAISCFSGILGALTAMVRMLFALSRAGLAPSLAWLHPVHRTPGRAVVVSTIAILLPVCVALFFVLPGDYYGYLSTIATLALILVYGAVTLAEAVEAAQARRLAWAFLGATGTAALAWSLLCSITPVPPPPANLWPYLVLAWALLGVALPLWRPALRRFG